ncbi:AMP-binding protein [Calditrichota bacterium LG25]
MAENSLTIPAILESNFSRSSTRVIFNFPDGSSATFAVFYNRVELLSEFLLRNGIKKGDCVAILDSRFTNLPIIYFALAQIGAITIPIVPALSDEDLHFFLKQNRIVAVFAAQEIKPRIKQHSYHHLKFFIDIHSFKFELLQEDTVSEKFEKEIHKIKKAALELVKAEEVIPPPKIDEDDEIQRLILPDLHGKWQFYRYNHKHLISSASIASETIGLKAESKVLLLLPFYFNLTFSLGVLGTILKGYQVVFGAQPQTLEELIELVKRHQPTHVLLESGLLERILKPHLQVNGRRSILKTSLKIFSFLKEKITGGKLDFMKQVEWLISANLTPLNRSCNRFLLKNKIRHHLLFGIFETTSVLLSGKAAEDFCWIKGQLVRDMDAKIEEGERPGGALWVKGPNVLKSDPTTGFSRTPLIAEPAEEAFKILGFHSTIIEFASGFKLDARVVEASLRELEEIVEVLIFKHNDELVLKVLPTPELVSLNEGELEAHLIKKIQNHLAGQFPFPVEISRISIERQPFPKTYLGQLLRIE